MGWADAGMGNVLAAGKLELCAHTGGQRIESALGGGHLARGCERSSRRQAGAHHQYGRCSKARSPRVFAQEFDLAILGGGDHRSDADLVDLLSVGGRLGIDPSDGRIDWMVLAQGDTGGRVMRERVVADLSKLPLHALGTASATWWGTLAFMLIEGTGFALAIAVYLYLMSIAATWPIDTPRPDLLPVMVVALFLIATLLPNYFTSQWAARHVSPI